MFVVVLPTIFLCPSFTPLEVAVQGAAELAGKFPGILVEISGWMIY